jgi:hypothetical protein
LVFGRNQRSGFKTSRSEKIMLKHLQDICVFALAAGGLMAQTVTPPTQAVGTTGMVGLAAGQYAQFNVLNPGVLPPATGAVCNALLTFLGDDGGVLKVKSVSITPGHSAFIDLFSDVDLGLAVGARKEIRATFTTPPVVPVTAATTATGPCNLIGTLELIGELTGDTQFVLGGIHAVPGSAPLN